jgi:hypothetical protein
MALRESRRQARPGSANTTPRQLRPTTSVVSGRGPASTSNALRGDRQARGREASARSGACRPPGQGPAASRRSRASPPPAPWGGAPRRPGGSMRASQSGDTVRDLTRIDRRRPSAGLIRRPRLRRDAPGRPRSRELPEGASGEGYGETRPSLLSRPLARGDCNPPFLFAAEPMAPHIGLTLPWVTALVSRQPGRVPQRFPGPPSEESS